MSDLYQPVSCGIHSEYELAIMHNQRLCIKWQDSIKERHTLFAMPNDIFTRDHAEYLLVTDEAGTQKAATINEVKTIRDGDIYISLYDLLSHSVIVIFSVAASWRWHFYCMETTFIKQYSMYNKVNSTY